MRERERKREKSLDDGTERERETGREREIKYYFGRPKHTHKHDFMQADRQRNVAQGKAKTAKHF